MNGENLMFSHFPHKSLPKIATPSRRRWPAQSLTLCVLLVGLRGSHAAPTRRDAELNGPRLNGVELLARDETSRLSLLFATLQHGVVRSGGDTIKGVTLEGTRLRSTGIHSDDAWVGALLEGQASDYSPVRLRIDHVAPAPRAGSQKDPNAEVMTYAISYQWGGWSGTEASRSWKPDSKWAPLCPGEEPAIPIAGRWDYHKGLRGDSGRINSDPTVITFACRGAAIAKCVEKMGYMPWLPDRQPQSGGPAVSMDTLHQACVRAVRADYCGKGDSLTSEGEHVNFYDTTGLRTDTESWDFEAAWTGDGAVCINRTRLKQSPEDARLTVSGYIAKNCLKSWSEKPCPGQRGSAKAVLFTEQRPPSVAQTK
jgi:hypothetical protein